MKNPLNGLSPAQLRDGVCVMSALYALDLATTDNYNMKLQLLTSAVLDPRMQGMFREASEQLKEKQEYHSAGRKALQKSTATLPKQKAREIKKRNLTAIKKTPDNAPLYFVVEEGVNPNFRSDTVVGTTPKKKLDFLERNVAVTPMTLRNSEKDELVDRLQTELDNNEYSAEELVIASKAIDEEEEERQEALQMKYSTSAQRSALDEIFRLVALYVLKNSQGHDMTVYQNKDGGWNWKVPYPRPPDSEYTLEVLAGMYKSSLLSTIRSSSLELMNLYDLELPKLEWLFDLYLPISLKKEQIKDFKNLLCNQIERMFQGTELILITMNNGRDPARKAIESAFDYYKSVLRQINPVSKQPTVPGIAVNYVNSSGYGAPVVGFLGAPQQQDDNHARHPDQKT